MNRSRFLRLLMTAVLFTFCYEGSAATRTWTGAVSSDWFDGGNWSGATAPAAGDDVTIDGTGETPLLTNSTPELASLTLSGTLVFTNWNTTLSATNVTIQSSGKMTLPPAYTNNVMSNNVMIVCSNLMIASGGAIDTAGRGYSGALSAKTDGFGPGAGVSAGSHYGSGGAHGGYGGESAHLYIGGLPIGSAETPVLPGSGGGGGYSGQGGNGGGAVWIEASGEVTIQGEITADGHPPSSGWGGAGSGGSIFIQCASISGEGTLSARGGSATGVSAGSGGGGRIAIGYDPDIQSPVPGCGLTIRTGGGTSPYPGGTGSLYLPDARFLGTRIEGIEGQLVGLTEYRVDSLVVTNTRVQFPNDGFVLEVTNDLVLAEARLDLGGEDLFHQADHLFEYAGITNPCRLDVGGDLRMDKNAGLHVYSARTNGTETSRGARMDVGGSIRLTDNSWIFPYSHPTNGGSVRIEAADMSIASGCGVNADGRGCVGGSKFQDGYGTGGGKASGNYGAGGGYGGIGGEQSFRMAARPYGSTDAPSDPGSGGSGSLWGPGQDGGGYIGIFLAGDMVCNGTLTANGHEAKSAYHGAGSGGGIYVNCDRLIATNGLVSARGGVATAHAAGNGGGGGRIALDYNVLVEPASLSIRADGGPSQDKPGDLGTVKIPDHRLLVEDNRGWLSGELHGITNWAPQSLVLSNAWVRFPDAGFELDVQQDLDVIGSGGRLEMGGGELLDVFAFVHCQTGEFSRLTVGGDMTLSEGGSAVLYSTVATDPENDPGAWLAVSGHLRIATNSWLAAISHPTNGASPRILADRVSIEGGGVLRAGRYLYGGDYNPIPAGFAWGIDNVHPEGYGPGGGAQKIGGSYGGRGGAASGGLTDSAKMYGSSNAPALPGSGGGNGYTGVSAFGGGLAYLEVSRSMTVDGQIDMRGGNGYGVYRAGGSGGGIHIRTPKFSGNGALIAKGGSANSNAGGGGGGRIAVWSTYNTFGKGNVDVSGGAGASGYGNGEEGTVVWGWIPPPGTLIFLR